MNLGKLTRLEISWSISRARDTCGYNICRLTVFGPVVNFSRDSKRFSCNGGGYDMIGTVLAEWIVNAFQTRLAALGALYPGMYHNTADGFFEIDGACGRETVTRIAEKIGLELEPIIDRKGNVTGWIVEDLRHEEKKAV